MIVKSRPAMLSTPAEAMPEERQQEILRRLRSSGRVVAADLAREFGVSEDSIRRDLRDLAARGWCRRVYGGALVDAADRSPLSARGRQRGEQKVALARRAAGLVRAGQVLLIDGGSTNSAIADALPADWGLTVITTAPDIAHRLMERPGFEILMIGGRIDARVGAAVGAQAVAEIRRLRADLCFPGVCAIDAESGAWVIDSEEALVKRAMVQSSGAAAIVATTDKFAASAAHQVAGLEAIDYLVVDRDAPADLAAAFRRRSITVHRVGTATEP